MTERTLLRSDTLTSCRDRVLRLRTPADWSPDSDPPRLTVDVDAIRSALRLHARLCPEA